MKKELLENRKHWTISKRKIRKGKGTCDVLEHVHLYAYVATDFRYPFKLFMQGSTWGNYIGKNFHSEYQ